MLASKHLLKGEDIIKKVKTEGKLFQSRNFGVSVLHTKSNDDPKFAFVISLKIDKSAVHRNRIKRAFTHAVRLNVGFVPKGYSMVFLTKTSIASMTTEEIMKETIGFLKKQEFLK